MAFAPPAAVDVDVHEAWGQDEVVGKALRAPRHGAAEPGVGDRSDPPLDHLHHDVRALDAPDDGATAQPVGRTHGRSGDLRVSG